MVGLAGLLHDIGEQRLPSQIRWKTEPLTRPEKSLFELHPLYGKEILHGLPGVPNIVADIVAQHHENLNGTGYPRRLTDEQILPLAKIIRVVDEYQYLTNPREAQHPRLQPNQALAELYVKRPQHLSMKVIIALVRVVSVYPPGTLVELSDGSLAIVLNTSSNESLRPTVMAYDRRDTDFDTRLIDLNEQRHLSISRIVMTSELPSDLAERITRRTRSIISSYRASAERIPTESPKRRHGPWRKSKRTIWKTKLSTYRSVSWSRTTIRIWSPS